MGKQAALLVLIVAGGSLAIAAQDPKEPSKAQLEKEATAAEAKPLYPAVPGHGPAYAVPDAVDHPKASEKWNALYNLTKAADSPSKPLPGLGHAARLYNVLASVGVPPKKVHLVAVAHGPGTDAVLDNAAYRAKHGVDNPNLPLIRSLEAQGAKIMVCGQALADNKIPHEHVAKEVEIAVSALVVLVHYQDQGYALMPY